MRVFFVASVLTLLLPLTALAQLEGLENLAPSFSLSVDPQYPAPYSKATITAESNMLDLANAILTLTVSGKQIYQGSVQPTTVTLGKAGSGVQVTATISSGGTTYNQTVTIRPQEVSLIVEPISSAPPLYAGKPSMPIGGSTRIVAVANFRNASGGAIDPTTLSYVWTVDDTQIANSSGVGKSAVIVASPLPYRGRTVSVAITSRDGAFVGGDSLSLSPQEPSVRIYENDPLLGIRFDRALLDTYAVSTESTLYGAPFSVSITNGAPFLQWFVNGTSAQTGNSITLRPTGSGEGSASLSLTASSGGDTSATTNLSLTFGKETRSNFFGL